MIRRLFIALAGAALLTGCGGSAGTSDKEAEAAGGPYVRAHSIRDLMANVVEVQAQVYWRSAGAISDEKGIRDLTPTTDEAWLATRSAAATVTEMGNLLMTPLYAEGRGDDWMQFSKALVEIGMRAEKAAADKNSDAVFEVGGTMYNVCQACHQVYPPKEVPTPGQADAGNATG